MRTPAGNECPFFYGDYYRGRQREECRLLQSAQPPLPWKPALCETCPVPRIMAANACEYMILAPRLARPFPFLRQVVQVRASCLKSKEQGFDPHVGCGQCHRLPDIFVKSGNDPDTSA
jgi:hypothetical protein